MTENGRETKNKIVRSKGWEGSGGGIQISETTKGVFEASTGWTG